MEKITVVGAGNVGTSTARMLAIKELCQNIALIDIRAGTAKGNALDIQESAALSQFDTRLMGFSDLRAVEDSDLVIITAGYPRKPGMQRSDVLSCNLPIAYEIAEHIQRYSPQAFILVVTNPIDPLTYLIWRNLQWPRQRIAGLGGVLDIARMASFIALETGLSMKSISAMVLGGHGDAMLPLPRYSSISGIPLELLLSKEAIDRIVERTRHAGVEILESRNFSAHETPAAAIAAMVDAIRHNRKHILPCVAILNGEYNQKDIAMGVPVQIGRSGIERIIELPLSDEERAQFQSSAEDIRRDIASVDD